MTELRTIPIEDLHRRSDARTYGDDEIAALAESICDIGLLNPPSVRALPGGGFEVIAGSHRLAACDSLGWLEIACRVLDLDETYAKLAMIDENLIRAELVGIERDRQIADRKAIYETLHPGTRHGAPGVSRQVGDTRERSQADRFTAETAALTGQSERTIQRSVDRGAKVTPETAAIISGTRLDTGVYADRIKSLPADQQVETVRRDLAAPPRPPAARWEPTLARPAPKPKQEPGEAFRRFLELVDEIESIGVRDILAAAGSQRSVLGQRASGLADMLEDIMRGCS